MNDFDIPLLKIIWAIVTIIAVVFWGRYMSKFKIRRKEFENQDVKWEWEEMKKQIGTTERMVLIVLFILILSFVVIFRFF
jgi:heme/copper-type cytochrome/quinol oxidase subunit 2